MSSTPESAGGGPLALVREGDPIVLDLPGRRLTLDAPELARRRAAWQPRPLQCERGYRRLYQ